MTSDISLAMDIPKEYAQEMGFLAIETAWIDVAIVSLIARLAFDDEEPKARITKAECLVGGEKTSSLVQKLKKLFEVVIDDSTAELEFTKIMESIGNVSANRSNYLHSCLHSSYEQPDVLPVVKGFKAQLAMRKDVTVSLPALVKAVSDARSTYNALINFAWKLDKYLQSKKLANETETLPNS